MVTVLTALIISVSIKIVGALLISALLTTPVACSMLIARGFKQSIIFSVIIAEIAAIAGLLIAGVWSLAPGAMIVLMLIAMLIVTMIVKRGLKV
jgi:zinc transport system permease protein